MEASPSAPISADARLALEQKVIAGLSLLDRFLPVWILLAMAAGLLLGRWAPNVVSLLDAGHIGSTSLPIAIGLLLMMYPVLAKVRYTEVGAIARQSIAAARRNHYRARSLFRRLSGWKSSRAIPDR